MNIITIGLGFGDEGKGTIVDHLVNSSPVTPLVVRFSGGAQAAHNVITEDGFHHTFSQFGSGTLRGAPTLLSQHVLVDPLRLYGESLHLNPYLGRNSLELVSVEGGAVLVTRIHQAINHARERARGNDRHGSTGLGMGEAELYRLRAPEVYPTIGDLERPRMLVSKLEALYNWGEEQVGDLGISLEEATEELLDFGGDGVINIVDFMEARKLVYEAEELVFEGSQGVLLDEWVGFHPHTTWSTLTPHNAISILGKAGVTKPFEVMGITRTYTTRHGAGPFPSEDNTLNRPEEHNGYGEFQGAWRVGTLDTTLLNYAAQVVKPDSLAITHMDVEQEHVAERYDHALDFAGNLAHWEDKDWQEQFTRKLEKIQPELTAIESNEAVVELIESTAGAPARVLSYGPESSAKFTREKGEKLP